MTSADTDKNATQNVEEILESKVFNLAMRIAEAYATSKRKVFRLLQHAFAKLKEESARNNLKTEFYQQIRILMRLVAAYYKGHYTKVPTQALLKIIGGLVYFIWIIDLIPDFIPVLGLADDIAVVVWVYNAIRSELEEFEQWESASAFSLDEDD